jgi:hypothetical protein
MPRFTQRARPLRDLRRLQEHRLLNRVVNTATAESTSSDSSSSGGLGMQLMETDDMPPLAARVELFDLSGAWSSLLSPDKLLEQDCGYCADCSII